MSIIKKIFYPFFIAIGILFPAGTLQAQTFQIEVSNIQKYKGKVIVSIYDSEKDWFDKPMKITTIETQNNSEIVSFDVPYGVYGISVYQDVKQNDELDRNFIGIPKEPIAFGNNYKPFGEPSFESASVNFDDDYQVQKIALYKVF